MFALPSFLADALLSGRESSSQAVPGSGWNQRDTDAHLSVLSKSAWFRTLVQNSLSHIAVDSSSGELTWERRPLAASLPCLDRCLAGALHAVCRTAHSGASDCTRASTALQFGDMGKATESTSDAATVSPDATQLLPALHEALLLRLVPDLLACRGPLAPAAAAAASAAPHSAPASAASSGTVSLLLQTHPAAAILCRTAVELAIALALSPAEGRVQGPSDAEVPPPVAVVGAGGCEDSDPGGGGMSLNRLVVQCCERLKAAGAAEAEVEVEVEASSGGMALGQAVAAYTLTAVCVALADPAAATATAVGDVRQQGGRDGRAVQACGENVRALLMAVLGVVCTAPKRQAAALRQHLHALLLPALLRAFAAQLQPRDYAAAAAQCLAAVRGDDPLESVGGNGNDDSARHPTDAVPMPPSLAATPAVREAVATLSALDVRHVVAAVQHSPALGTWLLFSLLPPALLAPGDRPTRVRALHLLRALVGAESRGGATAPEQDGQEGAEEAEQQQQQQRVERATSSAEGANVAATPAVWDLAAVGSWGREEWLALADLLHVLEEHMFHLVQPVWTAFMPALLAKAAPAGRSTTLLEGASAAGVAAGASASAGRYCTAANSAAPVLGAPGASVAGGSHLPAGPWPTATWLAVPMLKACQHVNVSVRRLGLYFILQNAVLVDPAGAVRPADWWAALLQPGEPYTATQKQQLQRQRPPPPGLWLLEQLLPVLEHDAISWEHMPGCSSIQRHATAVRQLRDALTLFLTCSFQHNMAADCPRVIGPSVAAASDMDVAEVVPQATSVESSMGTGTAPAGAAAAAVFVQCCLRFALQGTERATAAAFVLTALRGALGALYNRGGREDGGLGSGRKGVAAVAGAVVVGVGGPRALLRAVLLPLLTRQALQHPRDLQIQIHTAVLDLVPYMLDPGSMRVADALELLSAATATATTPAAAAAVHTLAGTAGASPSEAAACSTTRIDVWLAAVLDERAHGTTVLSEWLVGQLMPSKHPHGDAAAEAQTPPERRLPYLGALSAVAPRLPVQLQLSMVDALSAAVSAVGDGGGDGDFRGGGRRCGSDPASDSTASAMDVGATDAAAVLALLTALYRSYGRYATGRTAAAPAPAAGARDTAAALRSLTLSAAPRLLAEFWSRDVQSRTWDEHCAYGIIQLVDLLSETKDGDAQELRKTLVAACGSWVVQLNAQFTAVAGSGGGVSAMPLDEQLVLLASGCVACRTARLLASGGGGGTAAAEGASTPAAAAAAALASSVSDLEPSLELSPRFMLATAGGGGSSGSSSSSGRMGLLPLFMELRWRLLSEVLASPTAAGISTELRRSLCERALEDLDCAPDAALPHILDALLAAAPYDNVLNAVRSTGARVMAADGVAVADGVDDVGGIEAVAVALAGLRLLQRIQAAVVAALRGARRVAPELAVRAPQLACHPGVLLAGCVADAALAAAPPPAAAGRQKQQQQQQQHGQQGQERELLAAASKLAAATTATVVPQLLQVGGSRTALAVAAHLCRAVLQPHPELRAVLLLPMVHLLAFSSWAPAVDAKGLLSRKYEPHQALPARATVCAWLETLPGARFGPFLEDLMRGLLRAACGCPPGAEPPGMEDPEGVLNPVPSYTSGDVSEAVAAAADQAGGELHQAQRQRWRRGGAAQGAAAQQPRKRGAPVGGCPAALPLSQDYSFLAAREASQSSTLNAMKVALWQTVCLLARRLPRAAAGGAARAVWHCLEQPHLHPNVRPLIQQSLLALLDRWPEGVQALLLPALRRYDTASYQVCVSLVIVGSLLLQRQAAEQPPGALTVALLEALMPWALHHRHAVRVPVQTVLYTVLEHHTQQHHTQHHNQQHHTQLQPQPSPAEHPQHPQHPQPSQHPQQQPAALQAPDQPPFPADPRLQPQHPHPPLPGLPGLPGLLDGVRVFLGSNPELVALRSRQALVDFGRFDLELECSLQGLFGIREEVLMAAAAAGEAVEVDPGRSSAWALHTRDRLPIDVLRALPAVIRSLGANRRKTGATTIATATATATRTGAGSLDVADDEGRPADDLEEAVAEDVEQDEQEDEQEEGAGDGQGLDEADQEGEEGQEGNGGQGGGVPGIPGTTSAARSYYQLRPQLIGTTAAGGTGTGLRGGLGAGGGGGDADTSPAVMAVTTVMERLDALAATAAVQSSRPMGLVVVASLLENIPNMAGLCRTCESLGCEALVLPSRAVVTSEAFKRQAVTSEKWLPLQEVGPRDLGSYLGEMRRRGYTLVAVEQAAGSVPLQAFAFPGRCVLLLGNEQSGVPQGLIAAMDACVEIPMLGVTRSLNAHVSGAMAVWQYVQQQQQQQQQQQRL